MVVKFTSKYWTTGLNLGTSVIGDIDIVKPRCVVFTKNYSNNDYD